MSKKDAATAQGERIDGMYEGLPYMGPPLNLKNDDPATMRPRKTHSVTVRTYLMDNPVDVAAYEKALHEIGLGWAQVSQELTEWIPRRETWKVFLRLLHLKYIEPEDMSRVAEK